MTIPDLILRHFWNSHMCIYIYVNIYIYIYGQLCIKLDINMNNYLDLIVDDCPFFQMKI